MRLGKLLGINAKGLAVWGCVVLGEINACGGKPLSDYKLSKELDASIYGATPIEDDAALGDAATLNACALELYSLPYGAACNCMTDCAGENVSCTPEIPDGLPRRGCLSICQVGDNSGCPPQTACVQQGLDPNKGFCLLECAKSSDCRDGQVCQFGTCRAGCEYDESCNSGHCNTYRGMCSNGEAAGLKGPMVQCIRNEECLSGYCDQGFWRCMTICALDAGNCPPNARCVDVDAAPSNAGACLPFCESDKDCDGLACMHLSGGAPVCAQRSRGIPCTDSSFIMSPLGGPCTCADQCPADASCVDEAGSQVPGGLCKKKCTLPDGLDYGPGQECAESGFVCAFSQDTLSGVCTKQCNSFMDCSVGRLCSRTMGCLPFCQDDSDCLTGPCNRYTGWCDSVANPDQGAIGASCSDLCRGYCRTSGTVEFCSAHCSLIRMGCPDNAVCVDDLDGDEVGYCAQSCMVDDDCSVKGMNCRRAVHSYCDSSVSFRQASVTAYAGAG